MIMKNNVKILLVACLGMILMACTKHDKMDDLVFVGKMAPQVNWTIPSTVASAGNDVAFSVQYYTTGEAPISHLEVWYNTKEIIAKNVSAPWVVSKAYTVASEITTEVIPTQRIASYEHRDTTWNAKERAYKFTDAFPTSNTRARDAWSNPKNNFSEERVKKDFGDDFMEHFKDSLRNYLLENPDAAYKDFATLLKGVDTAITNHIYKPFMDTTFSEVSQTDEYHFVNHVVPDTLDKYFQSLSFEKIITSSTGDLMISYSRSYTIDAQLKCFDTEGTAGLTGVVTVSLN